MAKKSVVNRNQKRAKLAAQFARRRSALTRILHDRKAKTAEKESALRRLQQMPRDSSRTRLRNRCALTGRGRGVFRRFGLGRNKLREMAMRGEIPGIVKASW